MQNKTETGVSVGLIAALAVCCGAKLLLLTFGLSGLAVLTGQTALIAVAGVVTIAVIGVLLWRRPSSECAGGSCPPHVSELSRRPRTAEPERVDAPVQPELIGAGREQR